MLRFREHIQISLVMMNQAADGIGDPAAYRQSSTALHAVGAAARHALGERNLGL